MAVDEAMHVTAMHATTSTLRNFVIWLILPWAAFYISAKLRVKCSREAAKNAALQSWHVRNVRSNGVDVQ